MKTTMSHTELNKRPCKLNPFSALIRFLAGREGSFRFRFRSADEIWEDLRYQTIADGKAEMKEDIRNVARAWNAAVSSIEKNYGQNN